MPFPVSVFLAGVQKSGTTTLKHLLVAHPQLASHERKEAHFFDKPQDLEAPEIIARYHGLFPAPEGRHLLDTTPSYFFNPEALSRIAEYNPQARLIVLFRDPIARAVSHWRMNRARGIEPLSFSEAVAAEPERTQVGSWRDPEGKPRPSKAVAYRARSLYGAQLHRAQQVFPPEQMLLTIAETLFEDHTRVLARIAAFLSLSSFPKTPARHDFATPKSTDPGAPTAAELRAFGATISDDIARFVQASGLDVSHWQH